MKKLIFTFLLAACVTAAMAVPAKRIQRVVNINGRSVTLTYMGDESLHFWQAEDGTAYRLLDGDKVEILDLKEAMAKAVKRNTEQQLEYGTVALPGDMRRADQMRRIRYQGERHGLVILVNFADNEFTCSDDPRAEYERVVAEKDYSGNGQHGSVRDYFFAQSYGQFDFVLDVVGPVTLSQDMKYYGGNDSNGSDMRAAYMVKEACELVDDEVDFSKYDWDGDGRVEQVYVVYAGYGEAQYGGEDTVWPHAWNLYSGTRTTLKQDGVVINTYACSSELSGNKGRKMDGIGTICHEFSHCFGLPDFYCTDYNHKELTMGSWSVLDQGSYNGNGGYCPASYTAYERWFCGWLTPTELSEPVEIEGMKNIDVDGESYILYNKGNKNEYYIMYNVQQTGWNSYLGGHGMLVLHVDYSKSAWDYNNPNNDANHLRMTPICADNRRSTTTLAGDPYPGTSRNKALTDTSKPAADLFNNNKDGRKFMGKPIEEIKESAAKISFIFDGGAIAGVPANLQVAASADDGFTAVWDEAENAVSYNVEYGEYKLNQEVPDPLAYELFDSLDVSNTADISERLDDYTTLKGFTGTQLYEAAKGLRFGSMSKPQGSLVTPELDFSGLDDITITLNACNYNASKSKVTVTALDAEGNELNSSEVTIPSTTLSDVQVSVVVKGAVRLKIAGSLRFYLHSLMIGGVAPSPFGAPVLVEKVTDTRLSVVPEVKSEAYYVRVRSVNKYGKMSDWTDYVILGDGNAVEAVRGDSVVSAVYSIDGRCVSGALTRGIYVIDGKKRVIR